MAYPLFRPYPTLHLLRESSIARAVAAFPDAADIYEKNMETLRRLGSAGWQGLFQRLLAKLAIQREQ